MRRIEPTESQIQCAIVEWATKIKIRGYMLSDFLIKIPNEGKRSFKNGKIMKKEGLRKGVSDLFLAYPIYDRGRFIELYNKCGLWLEVKSKKGIVSIHQMEWISLMGIHGYGASCVYSVDQGIKAIKDYLGMK